MFCLAKETEDALADAERYALTCANLCTQLAVTVERSVSVDDLIKTIYAKSDAKHHHEW